MANLALKRMHPYLHVVYKALMWEAKDTQLHFRPRSLPAREGHYCVRVKVHHWCSEILAGKVGDTHVAIIFFNG